MIKLGILAFTEQGEELAQRLLQLSKGWKFRGEQIEASFLKGVKSRSGFAEAFSCYAILVSIGATGIAIRYAAPLLTDKLHDPALIVIDERGQFVIPVLSGHVGGANHMARIISRDIGAIPVVTTATDVNGIFSVDEFAAENDLKISSKASIKPVAKKLLEGHPVNMAVDDDVIISGEESDVDNCILHLLVRPVVVGMGCRKNKDPLEVEEYFNKTLDGLGIDLCHVAALASIDVKKDEPALVRLADKLNIPFKVYSAEELNAVPGEFTKSEFVERTVGVSEVSARAAKAAGKAGKFLLKKDSYNGMTISVFEKYRRITFDYE